MARPRNRPNEILPFCRYCKVKQVKRPDGIFCSGECYGASGHRAAVGKVNGPKWAINYWKMFDEVFYRKWGHLPRVDQTRLLVMIGQRKTYKEEYRKKIQMLRELEAKNGTSNNRIAVCR